VADDAHDGRILWDLHLVRFRGDTLAVQQGDSTFRSPSLRWTSCACAEGRAAPDHEPNRYGGVLGGADDEAFRLTLYDLAERRQILAQILRTIRRAVP